MMKRARRQSSPAELQASIAPLCERYAGESTDVPTNELPRKILLLSDTAPFSAFLTDNKDGKGMLSVCYGGGLAMWGVSLCPPGGRVHTNVAGRVIPWSDGVYFFYQH
jgi:hypothetical protein